MNAAFSDTLILKQLVTDYKQIAYQFRLGLELPVLVFTDNERLWGRWNPHHRTIEIRRSLVHSHSWDTVLYVLKHEMAHQIVTEIFKLPDSDHSESYQRACDLLSLPQEFRKGSGELREPHLWKLEGKKTEAIVSVLERIQKLFALASSTNEAEAAVAIAKAHELMRKYNVQETFSKEEREDFRYLLFDTGKQRLGPVYSHLASTLINYYNVDVIFTLTFHPKTLKHTQVLEIYGRETNVLIAEYVLEYLLRTLEALWKSHQKLTGSLASHKKSYQLGVLSGFRERLELEQMSGERLPPDSNEKSLAVLKSLTIKEAKERQKYIQKRYPRLRSKSAGQSTIHRDVFDAGVEHGKDVQIRKGIHANSKSVLGFLKGRS